MTARARWLRPLGIVAALLVPLAFAGLYTASIGDPRAGLDRIPAAIVNEDELVTTSTDDGTQQHVLAGRQLVTELTGDDSPGLEWRLSNADEAAVLLATGEVYAVLMIPRDFSSSIMSLQGDDPVRAQLSIQTDDAHSYLAGAVAQSLGEVMARTFGSAITEQYITGIYAGLGELGDALSRAADGADQLADGAAQAESGAGSLAGGVASYTGGVSQLSGGLAKLKSGAAGLDTLALGVRQYTGGVSQLSAGIAAATAALAADPADASALAQLQALSAQLTATAGQGTTLAARTQQGVDGIQSGIAQSASGAVTLAANGPALVSGARELKAGIGALGDGASDLAGGLHDGAEQVPDSGADAADAAAVAADPVGLTVSTANSLSSVASAIVSLLMPLGLWAGAFALFLVLPRVSRGILASTASSGRVVARTLARAGAVASAQAALLVLLLHTAGGVSWASLPATLPFAVLVAAAFTAFHHLVTMRFGRGGLVLSLMLLALQLAAVGAVVPAEMLTPPFTWVRAILPISWAVDGMRVLVTGGSAGVVLASAAALAVFGLACALLAVPAVRRARVRALALAA